MNRPTPTVTVIAGPNGAGKSSLQSLLRQADLVHCNILNIDALQIDVDTLPADPIRYPYEIAKRTDTKFRQLCEEAISKRTDFAFECNLRKEQVKYLGLFENAGYEINLVFIWLKNVKLSFERVDRRVRNGGHFVGRTSITENFNEGLKNLDEYFESWNNVYVLDNSKDRDLLDDESKLPLIIYIKDGDILYISPQYDRDTLFKCFPNIMSALSK